jgi:hypothetical protein
MGDGLIKNEGQGIENEAGEDRQVRTSQGLSWDFNEGMQGGEVVGEGV